MGPHPKGPFNQDGSRKSTGHGPGYNWQFYPTVQGLIPSMRLISERDSFQDLKLLKQLKSIDSVSANQILKKIWRSENDYENDGVKFHQARKELLLLLDTSADSI